MFSDTSRYKPLPVKTHQTDSGDTIHYVSRRFLPDPSGLSAMNTTRVTEATRLDHLAHRNLGEATFFWRIADVNRAMHPDDLLSPMDRQLTIPGPAGMPTPTSEA